LLSHCRYYRQGRNLSTALTIITSSPENVKVRHQLHISAQMKHSN
jgi:hypothetical protein